MTRIHPIIVLAIIGAIAAFSVQRVHFSASIYEMLPPDLPEVQGMERLNRYFSRDGQLIVTVKADDPLVTGEAVDSLVAYFGKHPELVTDVFRELSLTELVTDGGNLLAWLWLNAPEDQFARLQARLAPERSVAVLDEAMEAIESGFFDQATVVTSYDPLGFSRVGEVMAMDADAERPAGPDPMRSSDGTFQIMYLEGNGVDFSDYRMAAEWLARMKEVLAEWEAEWSEGRGMESPVRIGLTGTPAFMAEVGREMERDMTVSVAATLLLISLLFWIMHRRTRPLSWLISAMLLILAITLNLGGFLFGDLSVMSAGFAAILMGLSVDYGIVLYREAMDGGRDARTVRKAVGPGILWAAATTAVVFLSLNLSSLPGLAEMGNLVAIGIAVGAVVMLYGFAPVAVGFNREPSVSKGRALTGGGFTRRWAGFLAFLIPGLALGSVFIGKRPDLEANFHPFRIRESPSLVAWEQLQLELRGRENAVPVVITGGSIAELLDHLGEAKRRIEEARESGLLEAAVLPTALIPDPRNQRGNAESVRALLAERERLLREMGEAGFSEEGAELAVTVFSSWADYIDQLAREPYAMPVGKLAAWSIDRLYARQGEHGYAALATVTPTEPGDRTWVGAICDANTVVASLESLGTALNERIRGDVIRVFLPMAGLLALMLALVFRSWRDLILGLFTLLFVSAVLLLATIWTPMRWNSFNICGIPLIFGTGLDFGIHMIFALRRTGGDVAGARQGIGKALLFCGTSSAIGFGSLATASAYGLASLGLVCAVGILVNMATAVWLLPRWYRWLHRLPP